MNLKNLFREMFCILTVIAVSMVYKSAKYISSDCTSNGYSLLYVNYASIIFKKTTIRGNQKSFQQKDKWKWMWLLSLSKMFQHHLWYPSICDGPTKPSSVATDDSHHFTLQAPAVCTHPPAPRLLYIEHLTGPFTMISKPGETVSLPQVCAPERRQDNLPKA